MDNLLAGFQDLVAQVPDLVQPLVIALAGAVPFIEGEGAAALGIVGGIHPVIAALAGIVGNFLCVLIIVTVTARTRGAIVSHRASRREAKAAENGTPVVAIDDVQEAAPSARKAKILGALDKYGVPGVSLLGPLLVPTMFTAATLAGIGIAKSRILFWQGLAIIGWTVVITVIIVLTLNALTSA